MPYQRIDCSLVVLRAHFDVRLFGLLPDRLRVALRDHEASFPKIPVCVDLFDEPEFIEALPDVRRVLAENPGWGPVQIGRALNIHKMCAKRTIEIDRQLRERGLEEPYVRLTEAPKHASRWRTHERFQDAVPSSDTVAGDEAA